MLVCRHVAAKVRPINTRLPESVAKVFREAEVDCEAELTAQDRLLLTDLADLRARTSLPSEYRDYVGDSEAFSEVDMCLVQSAFFGQYLLYPEHYGGKHVTEREIADFLMFWRATGYYLGIPDQYNAVLDTLEQTRIYGEIVMEKLLKPCMLHLSPEAIHMAKVRHVAVLVTSHDTPWPGCAVPRHGLPRGHLLQVRAGGLPAAQPVAELQSPPEGALLPSPGGELNIYQIIRSIFPLSVVRASLLPAARRQVHTEHSVRVHPGHHPEGLQEQGLRQDEVQHAALLVVRVVVHTTYVEFYILYLFIGPV